MTIHAINFKPTATRPVRILAHVHFYEGGDADVILHELIHANFTGPVTLNLSAGQVRSIKWEEKIRPSPSPVL
jgi:hypothetical protein